MQTTFLRHYLYDIKIVDKNFNDCLNFNNINYYKNKFFPICLECERRVKIGNECEEYNVLTSESNSLRFSIYQILIEGIKIYCKLNNNIKLLNLGGLQLGHQDLCLKSVNKDIEWYANEHPNVRRYYNNAYLKTKLKKLNIKVFFSDLGSKKSIIPFNCFDIILFTEIIEHLPINSLGTSIEHICNFIKRKGFLVISTPNLVSFEHRLLFLIGMDKMYWGNRKQDINNGFFGHVNYWHYKSLEKLFNDYHFSTIAIYGSNIYNTHDYSKKNWTKILSIISNNLSYLNGNFSNIIFYVFQKT
jgi:hypothetical protein